MQNRTPLLLNSRNLNTYLQKVVPLGKRLGLLDEKGEVNRFTIGNEDDLTTEELQLIESLLSLDLSELQKEEQEVVESVISLSRKEKEIQEIFNQDYAFNPLSTSRRPYQHNYKNLDEVKAARADWGFAEIYPRTQTIETVECKEGVAGAVREQAEEDAVTDFRARMLKKPQKMPAEDLVFKLTETGTHLQEATHALTMLKKVKELHDAKDKQGSVERVRMECSMAISGLKKLHETLGAAKRASDHYERSKQAYAAAQQRSARIAATKTVWQQRFEKVKNAGRRLLDTMKRNKKKILLCVAAGVVLTVLSVVTFGAAGIVAGGVAGAFTALGAGSTAGGAALATTWGATGGAAICYGSWHIGKDLKACVDGYRTQRQADNFIDRTLGEYQALGGGDTSPGPASKPTVVVTESQAEEADRTQYKPLFSPKTAAPTVTAPHAKTGSRFTFLRGRFGF